MIAPMNYLLRQRASPQRVLLVDDVRSAREFLASVLRQRGVAIETAVNGREAWNLIVDHIPDIVITDYEMPVWSGSQLIRAIRESDDNELADVPVILVTARDRRDLPEGLLSHPRNYFLQKPISTEKLDAVLNTVLVDESG